MLNLIEVTILYQLLAGISPLIFLFYQKREGLNILFTHLFCSFLCTLMIFITHFYRLENLIFFNSYIFSASVLLPLMYYKSVEKKFIKHLILIVFIINLTLLISELIKTDFLVISLVSENILEITLCLFFYFDFLLSNELSSSKKLFFWINTSFFIYNCFSFLFNLYITEIMHSHLWFIHNIVEGSSKLFITLSIWKFSRENN